MQQNAMNSLNSHMQYDPEGIKQSWLVNREDPDDLRTNAALIQGSSGLQTISQKLIPSLNIESEKREKRGVLRNCYSQPQSKFKGMSVLSIVSIYPKALCINKELHLDQSVRMVVWEEGKEASAPSSSHLALTTSAHWPGLSRWLPSPLLQRIRRLCKHTENNTALPSV